MNSRDNHRSVIAAVGAPWFSMIAAVTKAVHYVRAAPLPDAPAALQHVYVEEAQSRQPKGRAQWLSLHGSNDGVRTELQLGEEHRLILANVFRAKLIGRTAKVPAESGQHLAGRCGWLWRRSCAATP
jgi:hypothetical protein